MTKEVYVDPKAGAAKKFLYSSPVKRHGQGQFADDDEIDDTEWDFDSPGKAQSQQANKPSGFDVDAAWSIKKNINAPSINMTEVAPLSQGLNANVGKGFYSRHAGASGDASADFPVSGSQGGSDMKTTSWDQPSKHSFSYSYGASSSSNQGPADVDTSFEPMPQSSRQVKGPNNGNTRMGGITQGGRVMATNLNRGRTRQF